MKCDVIDSSVVNDLRQPVLYSFTLVKKPGYNILHEPETIHFKKFNKLFLNTITFYLEDDNNEEGNCKRKTLIFTLPMINI